MKSILLTDWNFMRVLRLFGGFSLVVLGILKHDTISSAFGFLFVYQGLFNVSCCGVGRCSNSQIETAKMKQLNESKEILYEEIK